MFDKLTSLSSKLSARIEGSWERKRNWDWNGTITAEHPIVAVSFLCVGNRIEWARSEKAVTPELSVNLRLGIFDSDPKDVQVSFSIGANGPRWRTLLDDPSRPPEISVSEATIGKPFTFCKAFGNPLIELVGLVVLREQVSGARNGLWHIKKIYQEGLPKEWVHILAYGRAGRLVSGN